MIFFQYGLVVLIIISILSSLRTDIEGRPAKPPGGFHDCRMTLLANAILIFILWEAGAFSKLP